MSFPDIIKIYNQGTDRAGLVDKRTAVYNLNCKSSIPFYLRIFFALMNAACANSFILRNTMHPNELTLFNLKTIVSTYLVSRGTSRCRAPPENNTSSKRKCWYQYELSDLPTHLPEFQQDCKRVARHKEGSYRKTNIRCTKCIVFLCLVKERYCFLKDHLQTKTTKFLI